MANVKTNQSNYDTLKDITDKYYHWRLHSLHIAVKVMSYKSIVAYAKNDSAMTNYPYYYMQDEKGALPEMYAAFCTNPEVFADIQAIDPDTGPSQKQKLINTRILKRLKISGNIQRFHYYNTPAFKGVWEEAKTDFVASTDIGTAFLKSMSYHYYPKALDFIFVDRGRYLNPTENDSKPTIRFQIYSWGVS